MVVNMFIGLIVLSSIFAHINSAAWSLNFAILGTLIAATGVAYLAIRGKITLGPKKFYIPLTVLVVLMLIMGEDAGARLFALTLPSIYLLGLQAPRNNWMFPLIVAAGTVSLLVQSVIGTPRAGGIFGNANIAVGAITILTLLSPTRYRWITTSIALVGLFFTGAEEAFAAVGAAALVLALRRDFSKRTLLPVGVLIATIIISTPLGLTSKVWWTLPMRAEAVETQDIQVATGYRIDPWTMALTDIKLFGHGYNPNDLGPTTVHNVPLRILYELGPLAVLLWLWVTVYLMRRSLYLGVTFLALSMLDHFLWTSLAPLYWLGVTCSDNEYLFKEVQAHEHLSRHPTQGRQHSCEEASCVLQEASQGH